MLLAEEKQEAARRSNSNIRLIFPLDDVIPAERQFLLDDIVIDSPVRQACRGKFAANSLKIDLGKATEVIVKGRRVTG